jgi:hypothetical protein
VAAGRAQPGRALDHRDGVGQIDLWSPPEYVGVGTSRARRRSRPHVRRQQLGLVRPVEHQLPDGAVVGTRAGAGARQCTCTLAEPFPVID